MTNKKCLPNIEFLKENLICLITNSLRLNYKNNIKKKQLQKTKNSFVCLQSDRRPNLPGTNPKTVT